MYWQPRPVHLPETKNAMTTYYFRDADEMLRRAKAAGRQPGCHYGGIVLRSGKRGFAIYRDGKVLEQYALMGNGK